MYFFVFCYVFPNGGIVVSNFVSVSYFWHIFYMMFSFFFPIPTDFFHHRFVSFHCFLFGCIFVIWLTLEQLDNACDDDDDEGGDLGVGEHVLHAGAPLWWGGGVD